MHEEENNSPTLAGRNVLVTGAARRIGAGIVRGLHAAGANVIIHFNTSQNASEQLSRELNLIRSESTLAIQANLLEPGAPGRLIEQVLAEFGHLDALVNNASTFYPTPLAELTDAQFDDLIGSNLKAPMLLARHAAPALDDARGCIVNMVDIYAQRPLADHPAYCSAKAALLMLTRCLALDLAPRVRVNAIAPGAILWPETDSGPNPSAPPNTPLARMGDVADIAAAALYLIRDAPYTTGQVLNVDGGRLLSI